MVAPTRSTRPSALDLTPLLLVLACSCSEKPPPSTPGSLAAGAGSETRAPALGGTPLVAAGAGQPATLAPQLRELEETLIPLPDAEELGDPMLAFMLNDLVDKLKKDIKNDKAWAMLGRAYQANYRYYKAHQCYMWAWVANLREPQWPFLAAICWETESGVEAPLAMVEKSLEGFDYYAPLQHLYGDMLLKKGEAEKALPHLERANDLQPDSAVVLASLGNAKLQLGRAADASVDLLKALELEPNYRVAHALLGEAYQQLGRVEDAQREMQLGTNSHPRAMTVPWLRDIAIFVASAPLRIQMAQKLAAQNRLDESKRVIDDTLKYHPEHVGLLKVLADVHVRKGEIEVAYEVLKKAEGIDAADVGVQTNLAVCSLLLGNPEVALVSIDRILARIPDDANAHVLRGSALIDLGRSDEARVELEKAHELDPTRGDAVPLLELLDRGGVVGNPAPSDAGATPADGKSGK